MKTHRGGYRCALHLVLCATATAACSTAAGTRGAPPAIQGTGATSVGMTPDSGRGGWQVDFTNDGALSTAQVSGSPAQVWATLAEAFATLGIEATTANRPALQMGNQQFNASRIGGRYLSAFLDCGAGAGGPTADRYQVTMAFMVSLAPSGTSTVATTFLDAVAEPRDVAADPVRCRSRGTLEAQLFELIGAVRPND